MISKICGKLIKKNDHSLLVEVQGICYEIIVPQPVSSRIEESIDPQGQINLITHHYIQIGPSSGFPVLVGFINEIERDFFQQFIKVSGIGPRAAVKALNKPISEISHAIDQGDDKYLATLPGIGARKSKEIIAKLQGKVGKYGLIQDTRGSAREPAPQVPDWQQEAIEVLLQLQYKKQEAKDMVLKALRRSPTINSAEELLNEIYKQRIGP